MINVSFVARSNFHNVVLCTLALLTLAGCGGEEGSSSAAAGSVGSDPVASVANSSTGQIDRSPEVTAPSGGSTAAGTQTADTSNSSVTSPTTTASTITPPSPVGTIGSGNGVSSPVIKPVTKPVTTPPIKASSGAATLDWMPPTENSDGSVLTNLAGYTVYYGTSPDSLTESVKVTNPGLTAYTVSNLPSGTWYFAVTSYSSAGVESVRTGTVSTTI
jgi:hypothetical protein